MDIRVISTKADYDWAMAEADAYFTNQPEPGTKEGDRFEALLTLIEAYENKHFPIEVSDPVEMLEFAISDLGRSQKDLGEILGGRSRASEILNRKRPLNLNQIRAISTAWRLPIAALAQPYTVERETA